MQLTGELWKSLISSIRCENRKALPEKRKHPRVQIRARVTLRPLSHGEPSGPGLEVWTRDVSAEGMSFTTGDCLTVDQQFVIELPQRRGAPVRLRAAIRQVRKLAEKVYFVGLYCQRMDVASPEPAATASANAA